MAVPRPTGLAALVRLRLSGVAFLVVIGLLVALTIALYQKAFTPVVNVTLQADRIGNQLAAAGRRQAARAARRRGALGFLARQRRDDRARARPVEGPPDPRQRRGAPGAQDAVRREVRRPGHPGRAEQRPPARRRRHPAGPLHDGARDREGPRPPAAAAAEPQAGAAEPRAQLPVLRAARPRRPARRQLRPGRRLLQAAQPGAAGDAGGLPRPGRRLAELRRGRAGPAAPGRQLRRRQPQPRGPEAGARRLPVQHDDVRRHLRPVSSTRTRQRLITLASASRPVSACLRPLRAGVPLHVRRPPSPGSRVSRRASAAASPACTSPSRRRRTTAAYSTGEEPKYRDDRGPVCYGLPHPTVPAPDINYKDGYRDDQAGTVNPPPAGAAANPARYLAGSDASAACPRRGRGPCPPVPYDGVPDIAELLFGPMARGDGGARMKTTAALVKLIVFMIVTSILTLFLAATIGNITSAARRPPTTRSSATSPACSPATTSGSPACASARSTAARWRTARSRRCPSRSTRSARSRRARSCGCATATWSASATSPSPRAPARPTRSSPGRRSRSRRPATRSTSPSCSTASGRCSRRSTRSRPTRSPSSSSRRCRARAARSRR